MKMQIMSLEKFSKFTKKLQKSVKNNMKSHRTEGQDCEGVVEILEHIEIAVELEEVGCVDDAIEDIEKASEVTVNVSKDENVHKAKTQSIQVPSSARKSSLGHLWVNLVGRSARDHPGQSQKYLGVKHTTKKVDQQEQIISKMREDKVMDTGVGKKKTVVVVYFKFNPVSTGGGISAPLFG